MITFDKIEVAVATSAATLSMNKVYVYPLHNYFDTSAKRDSCLFSFDFSSKLIRKVISKY